MNTGPLTPVEVLQLELNEVHRQAVNADKLQRYQNSVSVLKSWPATLRMLLDFKFGHVSPTAVG